MTRIGACLIVFLGLIWAAQALHARLVGPFASLLGEKGGYVVSELLYGSMYFLSFTLPILLFRFFSRGKERETMRLVPKLTADTPVILIAAIGLIYICAVFNNLIVAPLISPDFDYGSLTTSDYSDPYKIVLSLIVMAAVPGVCEELLFRGMILENLLPYGKTGAVITSAIFFGLMHQNPLQMFYTTMAGIVLGLIYIYTESIFCSMLVHVLNNAYSVLLNVLSERLGEASGLLYFFQGVFFLLSIASIAYLLIRRKHFSRLPDFDDGVFERTLPEREGYARIPIEFTRKLRLFFAPTVIVYIALTVLYMGVVLFVIMGGAT